MFASFVPEIVDIVGRRERYGGTYDKPVGVRQVIHLPFCLSGDHESFFLNLCAMKIHTEVWSVEEITVA